MWKTVQLGDLCEILDTRRKPITKKDRIHGEYPYYGATGIVDWVADYIFDEELVLIGEDGAKWDAGEKTAFIVDGKYWVNNHAHVVKPNTEKLLNKWLTYYLCGIDLKPWVTGMTVPKLNQGQLKSIPIPLPSLAEQQRIVAKLDAAFAEIDEAGEAAGKQIYENVKLESHSLTSLFFREKHIVKRLNEIAEIKGGKRLPKGKKLIKEDTGFPYIRVSDFNDNGSVNEESVQFVERNVQAQISRYTISSDDMYVSIAGTIGKTGIVPPNLDNANLTENAAKLVFKEGVDKDFIYFFTKTSSFEKQAIAQTRQATQPKLALERLGSIELPIYDLPRQRQIAFDAKLLTKNVAKVIANREEKLVQLAALKSAILAQELQPPQNEAA